MEHGDFAYDGLSNISVAPHLGWVDLPSSFSRVELDHITATAERIRADVDAFIVIGVGGSYLGAKAAISTLQHSFYNELPPEKRGGPRIYFAGHNVSARYLSDLLEALEGQRVAVNIISKSGTTMEPMVAFRMLQKWMRARYTEQELRERIFVTTDAHKGSLHEIAEREGYTSFVLPSNIGGRYSVLTAVGLLPMAVCGIDVTAVLDGARAAQVHLSTPDLAQNAAYRYAALRKVLYDQGKTVELMASFEPRLEYLGGWYQQLFGESEGKNGKGLFPAYVTYPTDLHSMGQYVQDGLPQLFETVMDVGGSFSDVKAPYCEENLDNLNYLCDYSLDEITHKAMEGTLLAHSGGEVPCIVLEVPELSPYWFGYLVYFFEKACAMSALLLGVNPFDQPGVEAYKRNMFHLLGKPE